MKVFDGQNFEELLFLCGNYQNYRGAIVLESYEDVGKISNEICKIHQQFPIPHLLNISSDFEVMLENGARVILKFDTGSIIDILTPLEIHKAGELYHRILVSKSSFDTAVKARLQTHEYVLNERPLDDYLTKIADYKRRPSIFRNYRNNAKVITDPMETETDTSELDDFLSGFKVK